MHCLLSTPSPQRTLEVTTVETLKKCSIFLLLRMSAWQKRDKVRAKERERNKMFDGRERCERQQQQAL